MLRLKGVLLLLKLLKHLFLPICKPLNLGIILRVLADVIFKLNGFDLCVQLGIFSFELVGLYFVLGVHGDVLGLDFGLAHLVRPVRQDFKVN